MSAASDAARGLWRLLLHIPVELVRGTMRAIDDLKRTEGR